MACSEGWRPDHSGELGRRWGRDVERERRNVLEEGMERGMERGRRWRGIVVRLWGGRGVEGKGGI